MAYCVWGDVINPVRSMPLPFYGVEPNLAKNLMDGIRGRT